MIEDQIKWGEEYLLSKGYTVKHQAEQIEKTPWSQVLRFSTSDGFVYLKQIPQELSLEPVITQILYNKFNANVPFIIAINKKSPLFFDE